MESKKVNDQAKTYAMLCHLGGLVGYVVPFGNLLVPFLIWQLKKTEMPSVEAPAKESLNFQISITIYMIIAGILTLLLIGIPLMLAVMIADIVFIIKAAIAANNGQEYHYPLTIKIIN